MCCVLLYCKFIFLLTYNVTYHLELNTLLTALFILRLLKSEYQAKRLVFYVQTQI